MSVPAIKKVRAVGARFLVELLTVQEQVGSDIYVGDETKLPTHQAYILDMGPNVPKDFGVKVGDRVWIDGTINFCPKFGSNPRKIGTLEFHMVKGVIEEKN